MLVKVRVKGESLIVSVTDHVLGMGKYVTKGKGISINGETLLRNLWMLSKGFHRN